MTEEITDEETGEKYVLEFSFGARLIFGSGNASVNDTSTTGSKKTLLDNCLKTTPPQDDVTTTSTPISADGLIPDLGASIDNINILPIVNEEIDPVDEMDEEEDSLLVEVIDEDNEDDVQYDYVHDEDMDIVDHDDQQNDKLDDDEFDDCITFDTGDDPGYDLDGVREEGS
jgi:hypothetical protein